MESTPLDLEALVRSLEEHRAHQAELERKWWYRWPSSRFTFWFLWACTGFFYALSLIDNIIWLSAAAGTWLMAQNVGEDLRKEKAANRKAEWQRAWERVERQMYASTRVRRLEHLMTPEWML